MDIFQMLITQNWYVKSSVHTATQQLHWKTSKFTALQKIQETDSAGRVQFCTRYCVAMNSAIVNPLLIYFTDDA